MAANILCEAGWLERGLGWMRFDISQRVLTDFAYTERDETTESRPSLCVTAVCVWSRLVSYPLLASTVWGGIPAVDAAPAGDAPCSRRRVGAAGAHCNAARVLLLCAFLHRRGDPAQDRLRMFNSTMWQLSNCMR